MMEEIRLCGTSRDNVVATNHCRDYFKDSNRQGVVVVEIDNILTAGIPFTDDYVTILAEKICDIINEDLKSGLTGIYK